MIGAAKRLADLGHDFGGGLHETEVEYLITHEFTRSADDILWRRCKLGLHLCATARDALAEALARRGLIPARWERTPMLPAGCAARPWDHLLESPCAP